MDKRTPPPLSTLEAVDKEIKKHHAAIISLKRQRNTLVPISRLPSEILSSIFLYNVLADQSGFCYRFDPNSLGCWIQVVFVCQRWKEVAMNDPNLWSYWSQAMDPSWLKVFVSRSKAAPLHIALTNPSQRYFGPLLEHLRNCKIQDRVQELHVADQISTLSSLFAAFESGEKCEPRSAMHSILILHRHSRSSEMFKLPETFTARQYPNLRHLILEGCEFNWESPIFTSSKLTQLTLSKSQKSTRPTTSQLLSILKTQDLLEDLDLNDGAIPVSDEAPNDLSMVSLDRLRRIQLAGRFKDCIGLLRFLSYPRASTTMSLHLKAARTIDFTYLPPFLSYYYRRGNSNVDSAPMIIGLSVQAIGQLLTIGCLHHYIPIDASSGSKTCTPPPRDLNITLAGFTPDAQSRAIRALFETLPLTRIRTLSITGITMNPGEWQGNVLKHVDNLEELGLIGSGPEVFGILMALQHVNTEASRTTSSNSSFLVPSTASEVSNNEQDSSASKSSTAELAPHATIPLPRLKHILFKSTDFFTPTSKHGYLSRALHVVLQNRHAIGYALNRVSVKACNSLVPHEVDGWRRFVGKQLDDDVSFLKVRNEEDSESYSEYTVDSQSPVS